MLAWDPLFPVGYVEAPRRRPGAPLATWCRVWGYVVLRGAPDQAWDMVQFLASDDAALADAQVTVRAAPQAQTATAGPPVAPASGRWLWHPPFTGQLAVDKRLARLYQTGSKRLDEGRDHGLEQLRHARYRPPCLAPQAIWPALAEARRQAIGGALTPREALAAAQRQAQEELGAAIRS
jgi:hypothetical protein